eukprot:CAMPEP_0169115288 /NCGR_PEP_ID=MMETSP1015-20121227/29255_1 /TAXON_ID=342587 /ORGANISM="Karlodinium micrum, Strain CCMP2283" /LENGTH=149 /DNA_ID=CAMNT_0009177715 /DNA_START=116 /DNA_END=561 /DNA_ORIENTATION=-
MASHPDLAAMHRKIDLEYGEPPPLFLNVFPLSVGVVAVCVMNYILDIIIIACTTSALPVRIGSIQVLPEVQMVLAGWCVIGIVVIVGCLIGVQTFNPAPLWPYVSWLAISAVAFLVLMVGMLLHGAPCDASSASDLQAQRIGAGFSCGW